MSKQQTRLWVWLASCMVLATVTSPCAAQIVYVRDAAGYVRRIAIPQTMPFGMGMQVQPIVTPDRRFVRLNVTPQFAFPMMDPAASPPVYVPRPNLGIFQGGAPQPAFMNQR